MPRKPLKPCHYPGCPKLTENIYCDEHEKLVSKRYDKYNRHPEFHKRYGRSWREVRAKYVLTHPFCEECFKKGILVPVEEVHHIIPVNEGGTNEAHNLMSLCKSCHNRIHIERGDRMAVNGPRGR